MIIVSQDKNTFLNFDNTTTIRIDEQRENYKIVARVNNGHFATLGEYATEERAKEILEGIIESYLTSIDYKYNQTLLIGDLGEYREGLVYRMPKE